MSKMIIPLTAERLRELLYYAPSTGVFTWLVNRPRRTKAGDVAGSLNRDGYLCIKINGGLYKAHRLAWLYMTGEWPTGQLDHINGDKADNRIANLRDVSQSVNQQNRRKARGDSKSGFLGVRANGNRWVARINLDGKKRHIGMFATPELAHAAYIDAKRRLHVGYIIE